MLGENRVRYFQGRVSYFEQSEARKNRFLASDWSKYETLPRKYRTLWIYYIAYLGKSNCAKERLKIVEHALGGDESSLCYQ